MPRHSVAERTDALPTALRGPSVYAAADAGFALRECGVFNTTATAVRVGLIRWTATGTQGTALTEADWNANRKDTQAAAFNTHSVNATAGDVIRMATLGAAIGAGVIWTFESDELWVPEGTANGIGIYLPGGTGQHLDFYFDWEE
jgi:hypothetical protein